jgi:uncharacterized protein (DUF1778 family)
MIKSKGEEFMGNSALTDHMHFRIAPQEKLLVEQAAEVVGLKPNTYARQRLIEAAERDLEALLSEHRLILDEESWNQLVAIMGEPFCENKKLKRAASSHKKVVK